MTKPQHIRPDVTQLKALTHPLRLRMLGLLRADGPATATQLAAQLGVNTGATSYHLGQLHKHGFILEDTDLGNARDRFWRASAAFTSYRDHPDDTPDERDAKDAFRLMVAHTNARNLTETAGRFSTLPPAWREAEYHGDAMVHVTPEQAAEIARRIDAFTDELVRDYPIDPSDAPEGARQLEIQAHSFVGLDETFSDDA